MGASGTAQAGAGGTSTEGGGNWLGLTLKPVDTLLASTEATSLRAELIHADSGESRGGVVLSLVVVDFVDGNGGVDDGWLDSLLLDDGLDGLVNWRSGRQQGSQLHLSLTELTVVVDVLAGDDGGGLVNDLFLSLDTLVAELRTLLLESGTDSSIITVFNLTGLDAGHAVVVLLGKDLLVLDGLNRGMEVVLVNLLIDGGLLLLDTGLVHRLLHDGGSDLLVDSRVMVTGLLPRIVGSD